MAVAATAAWPIATLSWCRSVTTSPAPYNPFDACLLMLINFQASDVIASCSQLQGHLGTNGATERRIKHVNLDASVTVGIHAHGISSS
jgi:hypothetical protein